MNDRRLGRARHRAVLLWNASIYLDSSALTAGTAQAADKRLRGATMGLHSMAGYAGGFLARSGSGSFSTSRAATVCSVGGWPSATSPRSPSPGSWCCTGSAGQAERIR
jgi:hypothetical protein